MCTTAIAVSPGTTRLKWTKWDLYGARCCFSCGTTHYLRTCAYFFRPLDDKRRGLVSATTFLAIYSYSLIFVVLRVLLTDCPSSYRTIYFVGWRPLLVEREQLRSPEQN